MKIRQIFDLGGFIGGGVEVQGWKHVMEACFVLCMALKIRVSWLIL